jgi:hypothetical protein
MCIPTAIHLCRLEIDQALNGVAYHAVDMDRLMGDPFGFHCGRDAMAELNLPPLAPESLLLLVLE